MTVASLRFNLWTEPWIGVLRPDGSSEMLGIAACLQQAHELVGLHDSSPLVVAGVQRLLTAILQAIVAPPDLDALTTLLAAGRFDPDQIAAFGAAHAERFDLFHPTAPFMQTGDVGLDGAKTAKTVAYLFAEVPSSSERSLYHHTTDQEHAICPACCGRGLSTVPAFASSGGAGIRPSINGVPPIYVFPLGANLFETLSLSLVESNYQPPMADRQRGTLAAWNGPPTIGKSVQVAAVGYLESLTFPARRIRLYPEWSAGRCSHCGQPSQIRVREMLFEMGHWLSEGSIAWNDPFVAFRKPKGQAADGGLKPLRPEEGKALWREYSGLLLAERDDLIRPAVMRQIANLIDRRVLTEEQSVRVRCIGLRTDGKAKIFEWLDESLDVPPSLLTDLSSAGDVEMAIQRADEVRFILESSFNSCFRPERDQGGRNEKLVRFKTVRARMLARYWQQLALEFRRFILQLAKEEVRETVAVDWANHLIKTGRTTFSAAAEQIGERADALRARVEAEAQCGRRLAKIKKEWLG